MVFHSRFRHSKHSRKTQVYLTQFLFYPSLSSFQESALTFTSVCGREGSGMKSFRWPTADVGDDTKWMSALRG
jgi:hypothetical protein